MINVLVTGAGGFVGKHLLKRSDKEISFHPVKLEQLNAAQGESSTLKADHVIHLAAKTFVPDSWIDPHSFYQVNVMGTQQVLDFCRINGCSLTYVSSYVYGSPNYLPIDERHPVVPNTPYNHSKLMGEDLCHFYNGAYDISTAIIRPFNLFGPEQNSNFLIPKIVKELTCQGQVNVETLLPKRDFLYIDDFIQLLCKTVAFKGCDIFNAGFGKSYSVNDIVETAISLSGKSSAIINSANKIRPNEVMDVVADIKKVSEHFSWTPKVALKEGLQRILAEAVS